MRPASLSSNVTLRSRMGASQFVNNTLKTILSTSAANLGASEPFGVDIKAVLCPPAGCYTPPHVNILIQSYWSDPSSWLSGQIPRQNEDVRFFITSFPPRSILYL